MASKHKHKNRKTQQRFRYESDSHLDAISGAVNRLANGLKNRQLSLGTGDESLELQLPDDARLCIKASTSGATGELMVKLKWQTDSDRPCKTSKPKGRKSGKEHK